VVDDGDAIAQALGFVHVVRREEDRPSAALQVAEDVPHLAARLRIEARRRFVEKKQLRIAYQGRGNGQTLLLSARELANPGVLLFVEFNHVEHLDRIEAAIVEGAKETKRLKDGELFGEFGFLQGNADALPQGAIVPLAPALTGVAEPHAFPNFTQRSMRFIENAHRALKEPVKARSRTQGIPSWQPLWFRAGPP
jgi:hypothetical protein